MSKPALMVNAAELTPLEKVAPYSVKPNPKFTSTFSEVAICMAGMIRKIYVKHRKVLKEKRHSNGNKRSQGVDGILLCPSFAKVTADFR